VFFFCELRWSLRICRKPVQLQYIQLIMHKTNSTDLSSGVYAILISVTRTDKKIQNSLPFRVFHQKLANKGSTELYGQLAAADT